MERSKTVAKKQRLDHRHSLDDERLVLELKTVNKTIRQHDRIGCQPLCETFSDAANYISSGAYIAMKCSQF